MVELKDAHFVALARKCGKPVEGELHRLRRLQLERQARGEAISLFEVACLEKALAPDEAARFARWAEQIARRDQTAIVDSDVGYDPPAKSSHVEPPAKSSRPPEASSRPPLGTPSSSRAPSSGSAPPPPPPPPLPKLEPRLDPAKLGEPAAPSKRRVLAESAATFGAVVSRCALCQTELDELAILEGRAREIEGGFACQACLAKFAAHAAPSKTPTGRAPTTAVSSPAPSASAPAPADSSSESPPAPAHAAHAPAAHAHAAHAPASATKSGGTPAASPSSSAAARTPSAARLGTPSRRRVAAARASGEPGAPEGSSVRLLVGGGVALAVALVAVLVVLVTSNKNNDTVASASPNPSLAPSPRGPGPLEIAALAQSLEREGHSRAALARLSEALASGSLDDAGRDALEQARRSVLADVRRRIDRVEALAQTGDPAQARALAQGLDGEIPPELASPLARAKASIASAENVGEPAASPAPSPAASPAVEGVTPAASPSPEPSPEPTPEVMPSPVAAPSLAPTPAPRPSASPRPGGDDSPVAQGARPSPEPGASAEDDPKRPATWMDDEASSLPWGKNETFETEHYVIQTSVATKYRKNYAILMEAFAKRYSIVFPPPSGSSSGGSKTKLILYGSQKQFLEHEPGMENAAGFYSPSYHELHCFHGPCDGKNGEAVATLAHETAHQFQHRASEQLGENAPVFLTEGLACFFEAPRFLPDQTVLLGSIPTTYFGAVRRALKAGEWIPVQTLISTPRDQKQFSFMHYAHAWALIHWCFYGPESKKSQKLLDWFWESCCQKKTTASDFEDGLRAMGYTVPKLDRALQDWISKLDLKNDPAVLLYEKTTGKKIPR